MIIRTNFYSEFVVKRRAPNVHLRTTVWLGVLMCCMAVLHWIWVEQEVAERRRALAAAESFEISTQRTLELARVQADELATIRAQRSAILKFAKSRLNWAPVLERVFAVIPPSIQLNSLHASCAGEECTLRIDGWSAAEEQPRVECDKFRLLLMDAISDTATAVKTEFPRMEDKEGTVRMAGVNCLVTEFTVEATWKTPVYVE